MYNKLILSSEEKLGFAILILEKLNNYNTTDWFVLHDDQGERISSMLLYLNAEESKQSPGRRNKHQTTPSD